MAAYHSVPAANRIASAAEVLATDQGLMCLFIPSTVPETARLPLSRPPAILKANTLFVRNQQEMRAHKRSQLDKSLQSFNPWPRQTRLHRCKRLSLPAQCVAQARDPDAWTMQAPACRSWTYPSTCMWPRRQPKRLSAPKHICAALISDASAWAYRTIRM